MILAKITRSKRGEEEAAWNLTKMCLRGSGLGHRKNGFFLEQGSSPPPSPLPSVLPFSHRGSLWTAGVFSALYFKRSDSWRKEPQLGNSPKFLELSASGCKMTSLVQWCQGSLWVQSTRDSSSSYLFWISAYVLCFQRKAYSIHVSKDTWSGYLFECSMKPNLCPMTHSLFYFPLFTSLSLLFCFLPLAWGIPAVWEYNNLQNSSQMSKLYQIVLNIFK